MISTQRSETISSLSEVIQNVRGTQQLSLVRILDLPTYNFVDWAKTQHHSRKLSASSETLGSADSLHTLDFFISRQFLSTSLISFYILNFFVRL